MPKILLTGLLLLLGNLVAAQLTYNTLFVDYDSAVTYKNLKVIPIRFKGRGDAKVLPRLVTLSQAIEKGFVTVSERGSASTENVHWLRINNASDNPVYIASGEVILGGRQDRMVTKDTIMVPTGGDQYIPVMCVEEGRWSDKEKKFAYNNYAYPQLRKVLDQSKNQVLVWKEVFTHLDFNGINASSLAYASRRQDKKYTAIEEEYMRFFADRFKQSDSTITGMVCISGDRIIGCDVFATTRLFLGEYIPLLHGYIEEAITYGKPAAVADDKVKEYLDKFLKDVSSQQAWLEKNGKIFKYRDKVIHITAYAQ
jgi:hypothetical protein